MGNAKTENRTLKGGGTAAAGDEQAQAGGSSQTSGDQAGSGGDQAPPAAPPAAPPQAAKAKTPEPTPPAAPARQLKLVAEASGRSNPDAIHLLLEACERYGVNPSADQKPVELASWRFYPGDYDRVNGTPDAVVIVTAGGLKLKYFEDPAHPMDHETVEKLQRVFGCIQQDPKTKEVVIRPLPDDLALPAACVTGIGSGGDHVYRGGYLKSGGKAEAAKRDERRQQRADRFGQ